MAVYTPISEDVLNQYLTQFDIGTLVFFTGIAEGVENTNYRLVTTQGLFILTLFEKRVRSEDLPFFIALMEHLHDKNIPCPGVISDRNGKKIVLLHNKPALITTFLKGSAVDHIEEFHAEAVGTMLAQLHLAGESFGMRRNNAMALPAWKALIDLCGIKADHVSPGLYAALRQELAYLEAHWPQGMPVGAIHADLFPDNVFFTGRKLTGVIDFYFSCTDSLAYDLMLTLNAWCFEPSGQLNPQKSTALLNAYQRERRLTLAEREALPFFGRAAALRIIATRLYDWLHPVAGAVVRPKNPLEYVQILHFYQAKGFPA